MRLSIKIAILLTLLGLTAGLLLPRYVKATISASVNTCQMQQMWIQTAKTQWALENKKSDADTPSEAEVLQFMRKITPMWCGRIYRHGQKLDRMPTCILTDDPYILGSVGEPVRCPSGAQNHRWGVDWSDETFQWHYR